MSETSIPNLLSKAFSWTVGANSQGSNASPDNKSKESEYAAEKVIADPETLRWQILENPPFHVPNNDYQKYQESNLVHEPFVIEEVHRSPARKGPSKYLAIVINAALQPSLQASLDQYISDLQSEGYSVTLFFVSGGTAEDLRNLLQNEYNNNGLEGALFIGALPLAWYEEVSDYGPDYPFDIYFMDLDGEWIDSDLNGKIDQHQNGPNPGLEIYTGRLYAHTLTYDNADEVSLLQNYFFKNHRYRTGSYNLPKRALYYTDFILDTADLFHTDLLYNNVNQVYNPYVTAAADYLKKITEGPGFEFVEMSAHSAPTLHSFYVNDQNWITYGHFAGSVTSEQIKNADPKSLFYNLVACFAARYTSDNYLAGWYTFANTNGLAAIGATKEYGFGTFRYFYEELAAGKNLGEAFVRKIGDFIGNEPKLVLIGDPTLTISEDTSPVETTIPEAEIVIPSGNVSQPSLINIWGYARKGNSSQTIFDHYDLEYGSETYPDSYTNIISSSNERTGILGDLDASSLLGEHLVKLSAFDANGDYTSDIKWTSFDSLIRQGWPIDFGDWYEQLIGVPLVADIDGDGNSEIGIIINHYQADPQFSKIFMYKPDGRLFSGWPIELEANAPEKLLAADLDLDGKLEIVGSTTYPDKFTYVWDKNGQLAQGFPMPGIPWCLADVNHDGLIEIVGVQDRRTVFALRGDGTSPAGWPVNLNNDIHSVSVGNIDQDIYQEVLALAGFSNNTRIYAIKHDGTIASGWPQSADGYTNYGLFIIDIDNNGQADVLSSRRTGYIYAWDGSGNLLPNFPLDLGVSDYSLKNPSFADMDGDNVPEILVSHSGNLHILDNTGNELPGWPQSHDLNYSSSVADIDSDNSPEILFPSWRWIKAIHSDGSPNSPDWPFATEYYVYNSPIIKDIDEDSFLEAIFSSTDGKIYVRNLNGQENFPATEWRHPYHDIRFSRNFELDTYPPNISHTPPATAEAGQGIPLFAQITDNDEVLGATYYYKRATSPTYNSRWMFPGWQGTIPPSAVTTDGVDYYIVAFDASLNPRIAPPGAPEKGVFNIPVVDTLAPTINHSPITSANEGEDLQIAAQIEDISGEYPVAILFFKISGSPSWQSISMTNIDNNYTATIPRGSVTMAGLEYYLEATDPSNNTSTSPTGAPSNFYSVTVIDNTPPSISHTPVTIHYLGEDLNLSAQIDDNLEVSQVLLHYREAGTSSWQTTFMNGIGNNYSATISSPEITMAGLEYYIEAVDNSTNTSTSPSNAPGNVYTVTVLDNTPPTISHAPIATTFLGEDLEISAQINDDVEVSDVLLRYRAPGAPIWQTVNMIGSGGDAYSAVIPGPDITLAGLKYYIEAVDSSNNTATNPVDAPINAYSVTVIDNAPPSISHTPAEEIEFGEDLNITAEIQEESLPLLRTQVCTEQTCFDMLPISGSTYEATIPAEEIMAQANLSESEYFFNYYLLAEDLVGNLAQTPSFSIKVTDSQPPIITHDPGNYTFYNDSVQIDAIIRDNHLIKNAILYHRKAGEKVWYSILMDLVQTDLYQGFINSELANPMGIEYYVQAEDYSSNISETPVYTISSDIFNDSMPPSIAHEPTEKAMEGTALLITAEVSDDISGISEVKLTYWRKEGEEKEPALEKKGENFFAVTIPGEDVKPGDLKYYISAKDKRGNEAKTQTFSIDVEKIPASCYGCGCSIGRH